MADAPIHRPAGAMSEAGLDREARIEDLLLKGLDEYFAGRYDQAIHVWTRVLFLDRGHARARAYIDRARRALAERQRESEELFHRGAEAFERGDARAARELLASAIARGGAPEDAHVLLRRLESLGGGPLVAPAPAATGPRGRRARARRDGRATDAGSRGLPWLLLATLGTLAVVVGSVGIAMWLGEPRWALFESFQRSPVVAAPADPLPVPTSAENALARARELVGPRSLDDPAGVPPADAAGLREALRILDTVREDHPLRPEADALRARIQRALIAGVATERPAGSPRPADVPR